MAITGALAAAARVFDPYPEAILALDFAGVRTGGRQWHKRDGIIVPRFEMLRGASSVGHAGFGRAEVNGAWRAFAPDAPLIGSGGLLAPELKTEIVGLSCRPADAGWSRVGSVGAKTAGPTYKGIFQSARMASGGATWHRLTPPASAFLAVTSGQLYTVIARYRAGTSGRVVIALPNSAGTNISIARGAIGGVAVNAQDAGPLTLIETEAEGDGVIRTVLAWTPNFTGLTVSSGIGPDSTVVGEDVEVLGLSIQAGAYVGNPPIDNGNLAATRTAVAQSVGGLVLPSGDFDIEQTLVTGPAGTSRRYFEYHNATDDERILIRQATNDTLIASLVIGGSVTNIGSASSALASNTEVHAEIQRRGSDWRFAVNEAQVGADTAAGMPAVNAVIFGQRRVGAEFANSTISRHLVRAA
jgi:hypothetical protein